MRRSTAASVAALALAVVSAIAAAPAAANPPGCAAPLDTGGEWRAFGADYSNTRSQAHEHVISAADVSLLATAWSFSSQAVGASGDFTGTPIIADGCAYFASTRGWVFAVNADTGQLVWKTQVPYGGMVNSSLAVGDRTLPTPSVQPSAAKPAVKRCKRVAKHDRSHCVRARRAKRRSHSHARSRSQRTKKKHRSASVKRPVRVPAAPPATAGTVYLAVSRTQHFSGCRPGDPCQGPYVVALDQATGRVVWATQSIDTQPGADVYASPLIYDGMLLLGVSGGAAELGPADDRYPFEGSMNFFDASTGRLIKKTWTIHPPHQPSDNLAGAGIWSTPAIDTQDKVAFVGAGNPFQQTAEAPHADSVLKFDVNPASSTFGQIIGFYKGQSDVYFDAFKSLPCVAIPNNPPPYYPQGLGSCGQIDQDFGDSPNLFRDASGRLLVGDGQKSGIYHVFDAKTMKPVWHQVTGVPTSVGGIVGATAIDDGSVYGPDTLPGYVWSLSRSNGGVRWFGPIADGVHWGPPVAIANGVVYSVDFSGFLDAFDASDGVLLARHPLVLGGEGPLTLSWGGVSVARHTIYASVGVLGLANGLVVALRPGTVSDVANDVAKTNLTGSGSGAGGGGGIQGPSIVAGPEAQSTGYATPVIAMSAGGQLSFTNLDIVQHDVTAVDHGPNGAPLFQSKLIGLGEATAVAGVEKLQAGHSYAFYCSVHPGMRGTLIVQ